MNADTVSTDSVAARGVIAVLSVLVLLLVAVVVYAPSSPTSHPQPSSLATLNALLNAGASVLLTAGFVMIRTGHIKAHRACMLVAFCLSTLFLITYVIHHVQVGSVAFAGVGLLRWLYFALLIPHIVLAAAVVPMALLTLYRGWTGRISTHRRIARWTLPMWLYVSVSGVLVYLMLYEL